MKCSISLTEYILAAFVTISIPIYVALLLALIINRKKEPFCNSDFFHLSISLAVADLATVIHSYVFIRMPEWCGCNLPLSPDWFIQNGPRGSFLAWYAMALQFGLGFAQHFGVLAIAINRFTRIACSSRIYDAVWSGWRFWIAVVLQWSLPTLLSISMAFQSFQYTKEPYYDGKLQPPSPDEYYANINFANAAAEEIYFGIAVIMNFLVNLITLAMYVGVLVVSLKSSFRTANTFAPPVPASNSSNGVLQLRLTRNIEQLAYQRELRLAFSGFLLFTVMALYFSFLVNTVIIGEYTSTTIRLLYIATDLFGCLQPYTLLLMSAGTRKHFWNFVTCRVCKSV